MLRTKEKHSISGNRKYFPNIKIFPKHFLVIYQNSKNKINTEKKHFFFTFLIKCQEM